MITSGSAERKRCLQEAGRLVKAFGERPHLSSREAAVGRRGEREASVGVAAEAWVGFFLHPNFGRGRQGFSKIRHSASMALREQLLFLFSWMILRRFHTRRSELANEFDLRKFFSLPFPFPESWILSTV